MTYVWKSISIHGKYVSIFRSTYDICDLLRENRTSSEKVKKARRKKKQKKFLGGDFFDYFDNNFKPFSCCSRSFSA